MKFVTKIIILFPLNKYCLSFLLFLFLLLSSLLFSSPLLYSSPLFSSPLFSSLLFSSPLLSSHFFFWAANSILFARYEPRYWGFGIGPICLCDCDCDRVCDCVCVCLSVSDCVRDRGWDKDVTALVRVRALLLFELGVGWDREVSL